MKAAVIEQVQVAVQLDPVKVAGGHEIIEDKHSPPIRVRPVRVAQLVGHDQELSLGKSVHVASVVEVEMGDDHILDVVHLVAESLNLLVEQHGFGILHLDGVGDRPPVSHRVIGHLGVTAGVEQHQALGVLDQVRRAGHRYRLVRGAVHQEAARYR